MRHAVLGLDVNAVIARGAGSGRDAPFVPVVLLGRRPRRRRPVLVAILLLHAVLMLDARVTPGRAALPGQDRIVRARDALPVLWLVAVLGLGGMFVPVRWGVLLRGAAIALVAALGVGFGPSPSAC